MLYSKINRTSFRAHLSRAFQSLSLVMLMLSVAYTGVATGATDSLTTRDILEIMESRSPVIMELKADLASSKSAYTGSRAFPNPEFFYSREEMTIDGVKDWETTSGIQQDLSFLWERPFMIASQRATYEGSLSGFEDNLLALQSEVVLSVLRLNQLTDEAAVFDSTMPRMKFVSRSAQERLSVGEISSLEAGRIESEYAKFLNRRSELIEEQQAEISHLMRLTGVSQSELSLTKAIIPRIPVDLTIDSAAERAASNSPYLRKLQLTASASKKQVSARKLSLIPDVGLGIGKKEIAAGFSGPVIDLSIEIPIWGQGRSELNEARAAHYAAQSNWKSAQDIVLQDLSAAFTQLSQLEGDSFTMHHEDYSAIVTISKSSTSYLQGEMSATEFVDAASAAIESLESIHDFEVRKSRLALRIRRLIGTNLLD